MSSKQAQGHAPSHQVAGSRAPATQSGAGIGFSVSPLGLTSTRVRVSTRLDGFGGGLSSLPHGTISDSKRSAHYPWDRVSPQLLTRKGEEIYYPAMDNTDLSWAWRSEWAIEHHRDRAKSEMNGLQDEFERRSNNAAVRHDERRYIKSLRAQLEHVHKLLRNVRATFKIKLQRCSLHSPSSTRDDCIGPCPALIPAGASSFCTAN